MLATSNQHVPDTPHPKNPGVSSLDEPQAVGKKNGGWLKLRAKTQIGQEMIGLILFLVSDVCLQGGPPKMNGTSE